ncbi:hypothetical protein [Escherichia coli]|uniref:hypothetical protein n=1 Tax=Escherichia coli TaxID=562 RepID=UPI003D9EB846
MRNNGIAANAVALHKDHIVGHMFLITTVRTGAGWGSGDCSKSFVDEVEAAWSEYAKDVWRDRRGRETHVYGIYP